jgi:hypothetical protein
MAFYLDEKIIANSAGAKSQFGEVVRRRKGFELAERAMATNHGIELAANEARIPADVYRSMDAQTKQLMTGDEGGVLLDDLLPLAKSVNVGKIVAEYRQVSDAGSAKSSISGQHAKLMDQVDYDYDGTLVLIHDSAVGREWRELEGMRSEGFDALIDDQAAAVRAVRRQMVDNFLNGAPGVLYKGQQSYGIKNSPNTQPLDLGAAGLNIDLTSSSATFAQIESVFRAALKTLQGSANNVEMDISFRVSADIWFNLLRREDNKSDSLTFLEQLLRMPGVRDIKRTNGTNALTGNEFIALALSSQYIQPVVGMGLTTTPITRLTPYADYNLLVWTAAGLQIKADSKGRSGVLYASA